VYPLNQSAARRAWNDTERFRQSTKAFWLIEVIGSGVFVVFGGCIGYKLQPANSTGWIGFLYQTIGAGSGGIAGFILTYVGIYTWNLIRAPFRQRDEARKLVSAKPTTYPIKNRNELIEAVKLVVFNTIQFLNKQGELTNTKDRNIDPGKFINIVKEKDQFYSHWIQSLQLLKKQHLSAGDPYSQVVIRFTDFVNLQVMNRIDKQTTTTNAQSVIIDDTQQLIEILEHRSDETIQKIISYGTEDLT
jgi:hypothetical protein